MAIRIKKAEHKDGKAAKQETKTRAKKDKQSQKDLEVTNAQAYATPTFEALRNLKCKPLVRYCMALHRESYLVGVRPDSEIVAIAADSARVVVADAFKYHRRAMETGLLYPNGAVSQYLIAQHNYFTLTDNYGSK